MVHMVMIPRRKSDKHISVGFYTKFWKLHSILCNRDYVVKSIDKWPEVKDLISSVLTSLSEVHELGRSEEKEKVELGGEQLYVTLEPVENEGTNDSCRY